MATSLSSEGRVWGQYARARVSVEAPWVRTADVIPCSPADTTRAQKWQKRLRYTAKTTFWLFTDLHYLIQPPPISCLGLGLGLGVRVDAPWVPYGFGSQVTVSLACKSEAMRRVSALHCTRSSTHNEPQFAHSNPSPRCIFQELKQKREKEKEQAAARRVRMSAACVRVGDGQRARRRR